MGDLADDVSCQVQACDWLSGAHSAWEPGSNYATMQSALGDNRTGSASQADAEIEIVENTSGSGGSVVELGCLPAERCLRLSGSLGLCWGSVTAGRMLPHHAELVSHCPRCRVPRPRKR